jgi:microcystin-dependent protein
MGCRKATYQLLFKPFNHFKHMSENPYVGEIQLFAGDKAPEHWLRCDGSIVSIGAFEALYTLLGTRFGGDGITTFGLPDLRSRIPLGQSKDFPVGTSAGSETVRLRADHLPAHGHAPACSNVNTANSKDAAGAVWAAVTAKGFLYSSKVGSVPMHADSIQPAGGEESHDNRMPVLALSCFISSAGTFPNPA